MKAALPKRRSFICNYERLTYHLPTFSTHKRYVGTPFICSSRKLLGVTIDHKLSFDDHIDELCNKLCQRNAVLSRIKRFLPLEQRKAYYNVIQYRIPPPYGPRAPLGILQRVNRLQKRSARVILDADTLANSVELFMKLNWLPLHL